MIEQTSLRDNVRERLQRRPVTMTLKRIADDLGYSTTWLEMFTRGEINNPSVVKIETLYVYLSGRKLTLD